MLSSLLGHYWTIAPLVAHTIRPGSLPAAAPLRFTVDDPDVGPVQIRGHLRDREGATSLLVILHGLGGSSDSHYMLQTAAAAERAGAAYLRLNLRGADGGGIDFYHAGLFADVHAALESAELARFERIYVLGHSIGGHIALRYAAFAGRDPRVRAVAAVCPPLDLDRGAAAMDRPERWFYRRHVLAGLKEMYSGIASRRAMRVTPREASAIRTLRGWDGWIVAPRYGYRSAEHYYAEESAAHHLREIGIPSLLLATEADPMVPADTVRPALRDASAHLDVRWLSTGGHVGFPPQMDLGLGGRERGFEAQTIDWLLQH